MVTISGDVTALRSRLILCEQVLLAATAFGLTCLICQLGSVYIVKHIVVTLVLMLDKVFYVSGCWKGQQHLAWHA